MTKRQSKVMRSFQIKMVTQLERGEFTSITLKNELFTRWLIGYMVTNGIPVKVIPFGFGVTKITIENHICPHCGGSGVLVKKKAA